MSEGRVCEIHNEWCPDGVCRWCEPIDYEQMARLANVDKAPPLTGEMVLDAMEEALRAEETRRSVFAGMSRLYELLTQPNPLLRDKPWEPPK